MDCSVVLQILRNDLLTVKASRGRIILTPKNSVEDKHLALVRRHKAALLLELAKWPNGEAGPRNLMAEPPRADERGSGHAHRPQVVTRRRR
jgi:hypothetical protein